MRDLLAAGTYCTGTIRSNRKNFPKRLILIHGAGSFRFATTKLSTETENLGEMVAVWWHDRREVFVVSTMYNTSATTVMKRSKGGHEKRPLSCPTMINDSNGVDLTDQHLSYYSVTTWKTLKWWKKCFWRLLDIYIVNSWIIFCQNIPQSAIKSQRLFRLKLIEKLV